MQVEFALLGDRSRVGDDFAPEWWQIPYSDRERCSLEVDGTTTLGEACQLAMASLRIQATPEIVGPAVEEGSIVLSE